MRAYPPAVQAHLEAGKPLLTHILVWLIARHRDTGAAVSIGFWTGEDHQTISVGNRERVYLGAGAMLDMDALVQREGLEVRQHEIVVSPLTPGMIDVLGAHDPRLAPVQIHEWFHDPATMLPLADPRRIFKGHIMTAPVTTPEDGGEAYCTITLASAAWVLTRPLTLKRSHEALIARAPGDLFRQYADISGSVEAAWGELIATGPAAGATAPVPAPIGEGGR